MELKERMARWRLILGQESDEEFEKMGGGEGIELSKEQWMMDQALAAIYNNAASGGFGTGGRGAGRGPSNPQVTRWLGDVRTLFDKDLVKIVQADAMERCGLKQLIFEPELLENLEPDMNLATTILLLKDQVPKRSKESVREFMKKIVEEINKLLESDIKRAVTAAVNKRQHSPIPSASALDFHMTIRRGIKNYQPEVKKIIPEHYYFFDRTSTTAANKYTIILDVDQSGSMGTSVIYSGIFGSVLASIPAVSTRMVVFDTAVVDLTDDLQDPVDLLFGVQLGGGTDIARALTYCQGVITRPQDTVMVLVTDLYEGGDSREMRKKFVSLVNSGVQLIALPALNDDGAPSYDKGHAEFLASIGVPTFACTPDKFPDLMAAALSKQDIGMWVSQNVKSE